MIRQYSVGDELIRKAEEVRNRAWGFLLRLLEETEKCRPANIAVFKQMSFFSPAYVLSSNPKRFGDMPFINCVEDHEDLAELEELWCQVSQVTIF